MALEKHGHYVCIKHMLVKSAVWFQFLYCMLMGLITSLIVTFHENGLFILMTLLALVILISYVKVTCIWHSFRRGCCFTAGHMWYFSIVCKRCYWIRNIYI